MVLSPEKLKEYLGYLELLKERKRLPKNLMTATEAKRFSRWRAKYKSGEYLKEIVARESKVPFEPLRKPKDPIQSIPQSEVLDEKLAKAFPGWAELSEVAKDLLRAGYSGAMQAASSPKFIKSWQMFATALMPGHFGSDTKSAFSPDDYQKNFEGMLGCTDKKIKSYAEKEAEERLLAELDEAEEKRKIRKLG